jgi:hypothetical protein
MKMASMIGVCMALNAILQKVSAFSVPSSPWSPTTWQLTLNVGREPGSNFADKWGSSRLVIPVNVEVTSDIAPGKDSSFLGSHAYLLRPKGKATFINSEGLQSVEFGNGGWKTELPPGGGKGLATKLRMWIDVNTDATRNDITLARGERIYLEANCWREDELEIGCRAMKPYVAAYELAKRRVEAQVAHDTGDRRLDGTDPIQTIAAYKDMAELVADRDEKLRRLQNAELVYPRNADQIIEGPWPGAIEWFAIAPTSMTVKRRNSFLDEYHVIGTWAAKPVLKEGEYVEIEAETGRETPY